MYETQGRGGQKSPCNEEKKGETNDIEVGKKIRFKKGSCEFVRSNKGNKFLG